MGGRPKHSLVLLEFTPSANSARPAPYIFSGAWWKYGGALYGGGQCEVWQLGPAGSARRLSGRNGTRPLTHSTQLDGPVLVMCLGEHQTPNTKHAWDSIRIYLVAGSSSPIWVIPHSRLGQPLNRKPQGKFTVAFNVGTCTTLTLLTSATPWPVSSRTRK